MIAIGVYWSNSCPQVFVDLADSSHTVLGPIVDFSASDNVDLSNWEQSQKTMLPDTNYFPTLAKVDRQIIWACKRGPSVLGPAGESKVIFAGGIAVAPLHYKRRLDSNNRFCVDSRKAKWLRSEDRGQRGSVSKKVEGLRSEDRGNQSVLLVMGSFDQVRDNIRPMIGRADARLPLYWRTIASLKWWNPDALWGVCIEPSWLSWQDFFRVLDMKRQNA